MQNLQSDWLAPMTAALYEAAHDQSAWPVALEALRQIFQGSSACFGVEDIRTRSGMAISTGTDPDFHASYRDHYAHRNILWRPLNHSAPGTVFSDRSLMAKQAFHKSVFFNEWLKPQDGYASLGCKVLAQGSMAGFINIQRGRRQPDFEQADFDRLEALAPVLQRTALLSKRNEDLQLVDQANMLALENMHVAVLVVTERAHMLYANSRAQALLDAAKDLCLIRGRLSLRGREMEMRHRLARCIRDGGGILTMAREDSLPPLQMTISPISPDHRPIWSERDPVALVTIRDPVPALEQQKERLQERFGLSPAEAALAIEIAKGDGRSAAAIRRGISVTTARTHLSNIFAKTGTHRQAELVRLMAEMQ